MRHHDLAVAGQQHAVCVHTWQRARPAHLPARQGADQVRPPHRHEPIPQDEAVTKRPKAVMKVKEFMAMLYLRRR